MRAAVRVNRCLLFVCGYKSLSCRNPKSLFSAFVKRVIIVQFGHMAEVRSLEYVIIFRVFQVSIDCEM